MDRTESRARTRTWRMQIQVRWLKGQGKDSSKRLCWELLDLLREWRVACRGADRCTVHFVRHKAVENPYIREDPAYFTVIDVRRHNVLHHFVSMIFFKKAMSYHDIPWRTCDGGRSAILCIVELRPLTYITADQSQLYVNDGLRQNSRTSDFSHTRARELRSRDITSEFIRAASGAYMQLSKGRWISL